VDYIYPHLLNLRTGRQTVLFKIMNIGYLSRNVEDGASLRPKKLQVSTYDCASFQRTNGCCIIIRSNWNTKFHEWQWPRRKMKCFRRKNSFKTAEEINNKKCVQFRDLQSFKLHVHASTAPSVGIRAAVFLLWRHLHTLYYYEHPTL
jgi:hypothetical protein